MKSPKAAINLLRTKLWLEALSRDTGLDYTRLEEEIASNSERSGLVRKWRNGSHCVTERKVLQIARLFPGSEEIFQLPLFVLLENRSISRKELLRIMKHYVNPGDPFRFWQLPKNFKERTDGTDMPVPLEDYLDCLYERGGIFSFISILYIVRRAEAEGNHLLHIEAVRYAYKSFPSLARHPDFITHWREILSAFEKVHWRLITTGLLLAPDREILQAQIEAPSFFTSRVLTGHSKHSAVISLHENEDPIIVAEL